MDPVHLHLMFTHAPIIGSILLVAVLAWGLLRRSRDVQRVSLVLLVLVGLSTIPVYETGEAAEEKLEDLSWFNEKIADEHKERAEAAETAELVTAGLAAVALFLSRRGRPVPRAAGGIVLAAGLVGFGLLAWTGLQGGLIRHDEIRTGTQVSPKRDREESQRAVPGPAPAPEGRRPAPSGSR